MYKQKDVLITNQNENVLVSYLRSELMNHDVKVINIIVAFINCGGVQLIINELNTALSRGVKIRLITSDYLCFSDPKAIAKLLELDGLQLKMIECKEFGQELHAKSYAFDGAGNLNLYVGSSNLTKTGILSNIEWTSKQSMNSEEPRAKRYFEEFESMWKFKSIDFEEYKMRYNKKKSDEEIERRLFKEYKNSVLRLDVSNQDTEIVFSKNKLQEVGLQNLAQLRTLNKKKGFVIAATGSGKTYLALLDVEQFKARRVLFVVHSNSIIVDAKNSFINHFGNKYSYGVMNGASKDIKADIIFATSQTLGKIDNLQMFGKHDFDYIIFDEAHHIITQQQEVIFNYFKPDFLLGLSATPERMDGKDVLEMFDYNIAIEYRTMDAIKDHQVSSFHYFGISDIVDYTNVRMTDDSALTEALNINSRVDLIIEKLELIGYDYSGKRKAIGFCTSVAHVEFMTDRFNKRGYLSIGLTAKSSESARLDARSRLLDDADPLQFIFVVDLFNEGVDIPGINLILMLRPTQSSTIFIQQLGRGLRKSKDKEYLTVIDFIGNYDNNYQGILALSNSQMYDPTSLSTRLVKGFIDLPSDVYISMDEISTDRIMQSLSTINMTSLKTLKEQYFNIKQYFSNTNRIMLMDFFVMDNAFDPLYFKTFTHRNYYSFVTTIDEGNTFNMSSRLNEIISFLYEFLPLRRRTDFEILNILLEREYVHVAELRSMILTSNPHLTSEDFDAALVFLKVEIYSVKETKKLIPPLIKVDYQARVSLFDEYNKEDRLIFNDFLQYCLNRYNYECKELENSSKLLYGVSYSYLTTAYALNGYIERSISSYREGVAVIDNKLNIFINLHKGEDIKETINYMDKFIDNETLQWQTQNKTSQESPVGKDFINDLNIPGVWNLFVRKTKDKINGVTPKFIYIGTGYPTDFTGNRPITFTIKLDRPVDPSIYYELVD